MECHNYRKLIVIVFLSQAIFLLANSITIETALKRKAAAEKYINAFEGQLWSVAAGVIKKQSQLQKKIPDEEILFVKQCVDSTRKEVADSLMKKFFNEHVILVINHTLTKAM